MKNEPIEIIRISRTLIATISGKSMSGATYYDVETGLKVKKTSVINMGRDKHSLPKFYIQTIKK